MKRVITILLILATVVGLSLISYIAFAGPRKAATSDMETIIVKRDTILATVEATGSISPEAEVTLTFESGGKVEAIMVERGQFVRVGDVLAKLETSDLELELARGQATLAQNEAQLAKVLKGPTEEELAAAKAELASALANYNKVMDGPTEQELAAVEAELASAQADYKEAMAGPDENDITIAKVDLERARIQLEQAQSDYDQVAWVGGVEALPQALQLQQATFEYEAAKAKYNKAVEGPSEEEIKAAAARLAKAKDNLENLRDKPTLEEIKAAEAQLAKARAEWNNLKKQPLPEDIAVAQAQVDQARASLEKIRLDLEGATIVTPFDGVVSSLGAEVNEQVTPSTPMVGLVDLSGFHIDVEVDEMDISRVAVSQPVSITLDALPEQEIAGHIEVIAPTASNSEGVVAYLVTIAIEPTNAPLRAGMSADARITTTRLENVLVVPNRVIQIDRESGRAYVEKLSPDGQITQVEIQMGLRNELASEVVAGLEEGDKVVIRALSSRERLQRVLTEGPPH